MGKLFWVDGAVTDSLWLLHAGPGNARRKPDVLIPEPGGDGVQQKGHDCMASKDFSYSLSVSFHTDVVGGEFCCDSVGDFPGVIFS